MTKGEWLKQKQAEASVSVEQDQPIEQDQPKETPKPKRGLHVRPLKAKSKMQKAKEEIERSRLVRKEGQRDPKKQVDGIDI